MEQPRDTGAGGSAGFAFSFLGPSETQNSSSFTFGQQSLFPSAVPSFAPPSSATSTTFNSSTSFTSLSFTPTATSTPTPSFTPFTSAPQFPFGADDDKGKEKEKFPEHIEFGTSSSVLLNEFALPSSSLEEAAKLFFPTRTAEVPSAFALPGQGAAPFAFGTPSFQPDPAASAKGDNFAFNAPSSLPEFAQEIDQSQGSPLPAGVQMDRKILRAKRSDKEKAKVPSPDRKILRARRTKPPGAQHTFVPNLSPDGGDLKMIRMQELRLRFNGRSTQMSRSLVIRAFTPNGRYMLTHDRDPTCKTWYLWREAMGVFGTYDFVWQAASTYELLFLTNECLVLFQGDEDETPVILQYTLLDEDMKQKRSFVGQRGLMFCHEENDNNELELCSCVGVKPCFAGLLDRERTIAVVIGTGEHADCDIVTTFQITGLGLQQLGSCTFPRGTFPLDGQGLAVISLPQSDTFVVLNANTKNPRYGCVKYNYAFSSDPDDKETGPVPLSEEEWETLERYEHTRVYNMASYEQDQVPHPVHPVVIVTNEVSENTDPAMLQDFDMSVFGSVVMAGDEDVDEAVFDFKTVHRGRGYYRHNNPDFDEEDDGDDEEEIDSDDEGEKEEEEEEEGEDTQNTNMREQFTFMSFPKDQKGSPSFGPYDSVD